MELLGVRAAPRPLGSSAVVGGIDETRQRSEDTLGTLALRALPGQGVGLGCIRRASDTERDDSSWFRYSTRHASLGRHACGEK